MSQPFSVQLVVYGDPKELDKFSIKAHGPLNYPWKTVPEFVVEIIEAWKLASDEPFNDFCLQYQKQFSQWRHISPERVLANTDSEFVSARLLELETEKTVAEKERKGKMKLKTPLSLFTLLPPLESELQKPEPLAVASWLNSVDLTWISDQREMTKLDNKTLLYAFQADGKFTSDLSKHLKEEFPKLKFAYAAADASELEWLAGLIVWGTHKHWVREWPRIGKDAAPKTQRALASFLLKEALDAVRREDI